MLIFHGTGIGMDMRKQVVLADMIEHEVELYD